MWTRTLPVEDRTLTNKIILLVEDDADDEELTIRALRKSKVMNRVVVARDGDEALNYLQERTAPGESLPAVVLLDLKLPKVGGLEVLRAMRADPDLCAIPVVILTSSLEVADVREGYKLGANSYICKPVDFENFTQAVGQLGLYWVLLNEPPPYPKQQPAHSSAY